jgi:tetratricopeptide (TPR) repeat protein
MPRMHRRYPALIASAGLWLAAPALAENATSSAALPSNAARVLAQARTQLDGIESALKQTEDHLGFVERQYVETKDASDAQLREARFAKGSAAFADNDWNTAAVLFYDLMGSAAFKNNPNYDDALYFLAESLFQQNNILGARTYFRELLNLHRSHYRQAVQRYLEVAGRLNDYSELGQYVDAVRDPQGRLPPEVAYVYGKWLFKRSDLPLADRVARASEVLKPLSEGQSPDRLPAMYLLGVMQVQLGNYDEAAELFGKLVKQPARTDRDKTIIELSHLARGRIAYEQSQYTDAIDAYQNVDRDSENFVPALYEISWVFVKKGEFEKALRSTELLDELAPESTVAPESRILRAHLLLKLAKYSDASQTYKDVINAYAPVRDEVDALLKLHDDPVKYFDELLAQNEKDFNVTSLLPPAAAKWATTQQEVSEAVRVGGDLGASRKGVTDANDIATLIIKAIDEKGVNAFPVLQEGFSKAEAVDASLTRQSQALNEVQESLLGSNLGELGAQLEAVRAERQALEGKFRSLPKSEQDVAERRARYQLRLDRLDRSAFALQTQLEGLAATLNAIEKWVVDSRATRTHDEAAEKKFIADVKDTRVAVVELSSAVSDIRRTVKSEKLRSGNATQDDMVRAQYQEALDKEQSLLGQAAQKAGAEDLATSTRVQAVQKRIEADRTRVNAAKGQIQGAVATKADGIRRLVEEEQGKLRGFSGEVDNVSSSARNLVGRIAFDSFRRVRKQFYDLVLKADVGMVDVAWTKKQDDTNKIQQLSKQKDKELKSLDDEFKEVLKDVD